MGGVQETRDGVLRTRITFTLEMLEVIEPLIAEGVGLWPDPLDPEGSPIRDAHAAVGEGIHRLRAAARRRAREASAG